MKLELCSATIAAIRLAKKYNLDRIELCQNLEQGGMTPSPGMIEYALAMGLNTHVLIRPRPGGFFYDEDEIEIMLRDIRESKAIGAHGVVVGVFGDDGLLDFATLEKMRRQSEGMQITIHRAFDDLVRFESAMEALIELEFDRILSSGLARNVDLGFENLQRMKSYANGRIEIMCGGGVNASNVSRITEELQPEGLHFSATHKVHLEDGSMFDETVLEISESKLKRILEAAGRDIRNNEL
jgi:copper homeostasis protein